MVYRPPVKVFDRKGIAFLVYEDGPECTYHVAPVLRHNGDFYEIERVAPADYQAGYGLRGMGEVRAYVRSFSDRYEGAC